MIEVLEKWLMANKDRFSVNGVASQINHFPGVGSIPKKGAYFDFETPRSFGRITLWETGECDVEMHDEQTDEKVYWWHYDLESPDELVAVLKVESERLMFRDEGSFFYQNYRAPKSVQDILHRYSFGERFFANSDLPDGANFHSMNLEGCIFDSSFLSGADFVGCNLRRVSFRNANVKCSDFSRTDLREACFKGALVEATLFEDAILQGASFEGAGYYGITFNEGDYP